MLTVGSIVIRVTDLPRQESFWLAALDYVRRDTLRNDEFVVLKPREGGGPNVSLDHRPSRYELPPRIHLDLYAADQRAEVARLTELGATEIEWSGRPDDADYVVMADPEGTRFCVIQT